MDEWKTKFIGTPTYNDLNNFFSIDINITETKTFGATNNNLQMLLVGNEIIEDKNIDVDIDIDFNLPNLIDFGFNLPDVNARTGYIYFNVEIQQLGFGMWRGVPYIRFPDRNMIFPSGYRLNNGRIYWGTDIEVGWITSLVQRSIKLTGSKERDILAEFGLYDQQFIDFLKNFVYNFFRMMRESAEWYNKLFDNPNNITVAQAIASARNIFNAISQYGVKGIIDLAKQKLGDAYEYVKDNPDVLLSIGLTYALEKVAGYALGALGISGAGAVILAFLIASTFPLDEAVKKWDEWKQVNGDNLISFGKFLANYLNPMNADNVFKDWWNNIINGCKNLGDWIKQKLGLGDDITWEDFLNEISKLAPQLITEDLKFTVDITFEYTLVKCNYGFAKYDGWFFPKYHIYKAYNLQPSNYKLCGMIPLPNGDIFLREIELTKDNIDKLFNKPNFPLLMLKTWKGTYALLSQVMENEGITKFTIGSTFPSYLQMKAYGIPKLRIE